MVIEVINSGFRLLSKNSPYVCINQYMYMNIYIYIFMGIYIYVCT